MKEKRILYENSKSCLSKLNCQKLQFTKTHSDLDFRGKLIGCVLTLCAPCTLQISL